MAGPLTASVEQSLAALADAGLTRSLREVEHGEGACVRVDGRELLSFASCDYLGLAHDPRLGEAAARAAVQRGTSAGSARLLVGHDDEVALLERELAEHFGAPRALVFGSGYLANLGLVTGLAREGDLVVSDRLVHASTVDACRLSRAEVVVVEHHDTGAVRRALAAAPRAGRRLVAVEGLYSMDGDVAPLAELDALCRAHDATLVVDDAHGLGVLGPGGRGSLAAAGVEARGAVQVGNLGKALGSYGGFVLAEEAVVELLLQTSRGFVFTCALPPTVVAAARAALALLRERPGLPERCQELARGLRERLVARGLAPHGADESPVVPVVLGSAERALRVSAELLARGLLVPAVRPPTVPADACRLRVTVTALHTEDDLDRLALALDEALGEDARG